MPGAVFVDTSAWVGYFARHDQHHAEAVSIFEALGDAGTILVTSDYVLAETVTRTRAISGSRDTLRVWEELESGETAQLIEVEPELRHEARRLFRKYPGLVLSLTDCVSFALMRRLTITEAFTFDLDFRKAGFSVLPSER